VSGPVRLTAGLTAVVTYGGVSVKVADNTFTGGGGWIVNPLLPADQGLAVAEELYVSFLGPAALVEGGVYSTAGLAPGQSCYVPPYAWVWVNAASSGHAFTGVFSNVPAPYPPQPVPGDFPPDGPTGLTRTIPAYLYQQYTDDADLMAFFAAYNQIQQDYVDTFNALNLPIYTGPLISGALADWVMKGLYGYPRPTLYTPRNNPIGPLNTWYPNYSGVGPNMLRYLGPQNAVVADDDLYKRCLTWHYMKGDGKYFNVRWLKRRVMRFLIGGAGTSPPIDQTNQISVTFGPNYECTIRIVLHVRTVVGGALPNLFGPNGTRVISGRAEFGGLVVLSAGSVTSMGLGTQPNGMISTVTNLPPIPNADDFREAVMTGVLELPFQFTYDVVIG
jgi:hypothetical protein